VLTLSLVDDLRDLNAAPLYGAVDFGAPLRPDQPLDCGLSDLLDDRNPNPTISQASMMGLVSLLDSIGRLDV
jgi:hypothetical protein